jgi:hypothetical protein
VELEAHIQLGGDGFMLIGLDDTRKNDSRIILGGKDLCETMQKVFRQRRKVVKVPSG